jgi:CRISPR/Cas system-associated endoribonuclease Cas2
MDKVSVIQMVESLKSLNLERTPDCVIEKMLEPLFYFPLVHLEIQKGTIAVRTRIMDSEIFTSLDEISYRTEKTEEIKRGRCNDVGESVFYCSISSSDIKAIETNYLEVLPDFEKNKNSMIQTVSGRWRFQRNMNILVVGGDRNNPNLCRVGKDKFKFYDSLKNTPSIDAEYIESVELIDSFLSFEFSKRVSEGEEYKYKISAIYSRMLRDIGYLGIIYPSVKAKGAGLNLTLSRAAIDEGYLKCDLAIYSKFSTRERIIGNEHLMLANVDQKTLRWYEEYKYILPPKMKKYYSGESDDDSFMKFIHIQDLGD